MPPLPISAAASAGGSFSKMLAATGSPKSAAAERPSQGDPLGGSPQAASLISDLYLAMHLLVVVAIWESNVGGFSVARPVP